MALPAQAFSNPNIANYQILGKIAAGGMGVVYKAFDVSLQRTVALKLFSLDHGAGRTERERLLREARAASLLDHENIAAIHHVGETEDGQLFIDMGYYEGEDLAARMRRAPVTVAESVDIVTQVARGLTHAHSHNVIHRDIKPSNIIVTKAGTVKIVDFGLARILSPDASTVSLDVAGTLAYMSPEQLTGASIDARTDIWSVGAVLYEVLTGCPPFRQKNTASILNAILNSEPDRLCDIPVPYRSIVQKAMQKDPLHRYQSCAEFLHNLESVSLEGESAVLRKASAVINWLLRAQLIRWMFILAAVVAVLMVFPPSANRHHLQPLQTATLAPQELYEQGRMLLDRYDKPENLDGAISKFEQTTKADPKFTLAYSSLGEAYVDKFRLTQDPEYLKRAQESSKAAMRLNGQLPDVYVTMGRIYDLSNQHDLAQQEIQRAIDLDPRNPKALLALADAYANVSQKAEAERAYKRAIAIGPDNWDAYMRLASFYFRTKQFASAADQYRKVIELTPDNANAHSNLAASLMSLGKADEAEKELKEALRLAPTYTAYYNLALHYYSQDRFAEAAAMAELASEVNKSDYNVWQLLGLSYEWLGQQDKAIAAYGRELEVLQKAESLKKEDATAMAELGVLYSKVRDREKAMAHLKSALALEPENPSVLALFGEAYENLGDRAQALSYIERAIQRGWDVDSLHRNPDLRNFLSDSQVQSRLRLVSRNRTASSGKNPRT